MAMEAHNPISESFENWLRRSLIEAGELLRPEVEQRILAQGAAAVAPLIQILEDRALLDVRAGGGWAPIHAAILLGELRASEAIPALLAALADEDHRDLFTEEAIESLTAMGPAALEPVLQAHAESSDRYYLMDLEWILNSLGVRDERIFTAFLDALERDPEYGACNLAFYGDERGIEPLREKFDRCHLDAEVCSGCVDAAGEIRAAIQRLGGSLSEEQERRYLRASERQRAHAWPRSEREGTPAKRKRRAARKQQKASRKRNRR
jgi:HEAT repeat protein